MDPHFPSFPTGDGDDGTREEFARIMISPKKIAELNEGQASASDKPIQVKVLRDIKPAERLLRKHTHFCFQIDNALALEYSYDLGCPDSYSR